MNNQNDKRTENEVYPSWVYDMCPTMSGWPASLEDNAEDKDSIAKLKDKMLQLKQHREQKQEPSLH